MKVYENALNEEIPSIKNLKIFEEIGKISFLHLTTDQIPFFDQQNSSKKWEDSTDNSLLFFTEDLDFKLNKYTLKFKFKVQDCDRWQLKKIEYNV